MKLGKTNTLKAHRTTENGCYLIDENGEEVLLPNAYVPKDLKLGEYLSVFVYLDNLQRITATTLVPKLEVESFAFLEVMDVNNMGAFLDIGLAKQLLVPYGEQATKLEKGDKRVFYMLLDEKTNRLIGSTKLNDFLFDEDVNLSNGEKVDLLCYKRTNLGMNVIVNQMFKGLIFNSDLHQNLRVGDALPGYVKLVRDDGKIDIVLEPVGYKNTIDKNSQLILDALQANNGVLSLTDKSSPEAIKSTLGMSKKAFKRGLGSLYKQQLVQLDDDATRLL